MEGSAGDGLPSLRSDSRPLRSRIPVRISRVVEEMALMVQQLKQSLSVSTNDLGASAWVGGLSQHSHCLAVPLPPGVSTWSGSGMALCTSSRSRSRFGDEKPPLSLDSYRSSCLCASSPSPAKRV